MFQDIFKDFGFLIDITLNVLCADLHENFE